MQDELADLGQQGLLTSLELLGEIARMTAQVSMSLAGGVVALGLLMAGTSMLKVNGDKWERAATAQKLSYGFAAASSRYARQDLRCACTELLRGVNVCLILNQFGEPITCPIQEEDRAQTHHLWSSSKDLEQSKAPENWFTPGRCRAYWMPSFAFSQALMALTFWTKSRL